MSGFSRPLLRRGFGAVCLSLCGLAAFAVPPTGQAQPGDAADAPRNPQAAGAESNYVPPIQPASDEAARQLGSFKVPEGMQSRVLAAEPLLANPVAFWIDNEGVYYVCETFRQGNAVVDNRGRDYWLLDDLAAQTVEDRLAYYTKHLGEKGLAEFSREHDRIRRLVDKDGDGTVEEDTVFATGFNSPIEGTGAGVMKVGQDVYYTNIPNLWKLQDTDGDGVADKQDALLTGFGVRTAFRGHDMHGLIQGPDGRLYFSIGDRGFNVKTKEGKTLAMPDTGAVFRCEPDGSNLEVYAYGLRNPQELAFDDYGNLFTGDNNSDSGDKARWVYVAEGSDSGWRMYYQYQDDRGPWNRELMWLPRDTPALEEPIATGTPTGIAVKDIQPAYILPPVANLGDGPSGLTYYPGVGLPERYKNHFFLCDFRGTPANSGVRSFAVEPDGAGFKLTDSHEFIWSILCTDADFTPDGRFVVSDWVMGWNGEGKGRLYGFRFEDLLSGESATLLAEDFTKRTPGQLLELFSHRDRRVRQKAHLELAERPVEQWPATPIREIIRSKQAMPALHLTWAAQTAARRGSGKALPMLTALGDHPSEFVRAAFIRGLSDVFTTESGSVAVADYTKRLNLTDVGKFYLPVLKPFHGEQARLKAETFLAVGTMFDRNRSQDGTRRDATAEIILSRVEKDELDPSLRNAAVVSLSKLKSPVELAELSSRPSLTVRMVAVVSLRRLKSEKVADFLQDADLSVVTEAARAINDVPLDAATGDLAALAGRGGPLPDPAVRRIMNANFRQGDQQGAAWVATYAANDQLDQSLRLEAIKELSLWKNPPPLDRVTGMYRPIVKEGETRDTAFMAEVLKPVLGKLLDGPDEVRTAAIDLAGQYGIKDVAPTLKKILANPAAKPAERVAALRGLAAIQVDDLKAMATVAVQDPQPAVRAEARSVLVTIDPTAALPMLEEAIATGETAERQSAIASLVALNSAAADAVLSTWLKRLPTGDVPVEIRLDLLDAAEKRPKLSDLGAAYTQQQADGGDPLAKWRDAVVGGNAARGRDIFLNRSSVSCQRCHKVERRGGEVGPDLSAIGSKKDRPYLLEAIVAPNAKIAENFESVVVVTIEGKVLTGVKREDTPQALTIITSEGQKIIIPKDEIEEQAAGKSAMPEDILKYLTPFDVRDLVEYLAQQKEEQPTIE